MNPKKITRKICKQLDKIMPEYREYDTIVVFYCRSSQNFGLYDSNQETVTEIVEMLNQVENHDQLKWSH